MPIGKDSIQKRVAKTAAPEAENTAAPADEAAVEVTAETKPVASAKSAPKKKAATPKAPAKKRAPAKKAAPKSEESPAEATTAPATAVMANVSPETVAAVIGHEEDKPSEHVQIGSEMPHYLL